MVKYFGLKQAALDTGIAEYTLRLWCKKKKIRFNVAGSTKYLLRLDWLEEDLERMALENINSDKVIQLGVLRRVEAI